MQIPNRLRFLRSSATRFAIPLPKYGSIRRTGPIGFDLGHENLHMLQVDHSEGGAYVRAAVSIPYPLERNQLLNSSEHLSAFIKQALKSSPFRGRQIVTCMPADKLKLRLINYRLTADESEPESVMRHAMEWCEGDSERWVVDYIIVRNWDETGAERTALVATADRRHVIDFLEMLRQAGLDVVALEIGPIAILRLVNSLRQQHMHENVLAINFGHQKTYLTVLAGRRLVLDREIDFGEQEIISLLGDTLDMRIDRARALLYDYGVEVVSDKNLKRDGTSGDAREIAQTIMEITKPRFMELAEEVRKVLVYTASQMRGASVDYVYLLGSVARWPGADKLVSTVLSIPAGVLDPFSAFLIKKNVVLEQDLDPIAGIAIAAGSALRTTR